MFETFYLLYMKDGENEPKRVNTVEQTPNKSFAISVMNTYAKSFGFDCLFMVYEFSATQAPKVVEKRWGSNSDFIQVASV